MSRFASKAGAEHGLKGSPTYMQVVPNSVRHI